jgi:hypothetical protein
MPESRIIYIGAIGYAWIEDNIYVLIHDIYNKKSWLMVMPMEDNSYVLIHDIYNKKSWLRYIHTKT